MATFAPPINAAENPPVLPENDPEQTLLGYRLMRFYRARPAGRNVYMYKVGSVSATTFGRVTEVDPITTYANGVATSNGWDDIEVVFFGGHAAVTVTTDQGTALTAAGYSLS